MKISLVIPAYNESGVIGETVKNANIYLSSLKCSYEIIVVNDGSTDDTENSVQMLMLDSVRVLGYDQNKGKGYAVRHGMLAAKGDIVFYTDADLAYGLDVVGEAVSVFEETGADMVIGSRKLDDDGYGEYPVARLAASKCFSVAVRLLSGMTYDTQCGFKGFTREAVGYVFPNCQEDGFSFDFEVMMLAEKKKLKIQEMPVRIINHRQSRVRLMHDSVVMLRDVVSIRSRLRKKGSA